MDDLISRQAAIEAILAVTGNSSVRELYEHVQEHGLSDMWSGGVNAAIDIIIAVPPAQPEITDEQAIEHLQSTGWMQSHDRILTQSTWDIIRCKDCKYFIKDHGWNCIEYMVCSISPIHKVIRRPDDFCSRAERRTDEPDDIFE